MINIFRKLAAHPLYAVCMCSIFLLFSCKESYQEEVKNSYSGQELFRGIFFGDGPVADRLPAMQSQIRLSDLFEENDQQFKQALVFYDLVIKTIDEADPNFFNQFKIDLQSGNHVVIKEALRSAGHAYLGSFKEIYKLDDAGLKKVLGQAYKQGDKIKNAQGEISKEAVRQFIQMGIQDSESSREDACLALAAIVAVVVVGVIAAVVMWVVMIVEVENVPSARNGKGSLFVDQLINDIAVTLQ